MNEAHAVRWLEKARTMIYSEVYAEGRDPDLMGLLVEAVALIQSEAEKEAISYDAAKALARRRKLREMAR